MPKLDLGIAILGYGSQGRAWALNVRDSGHEAVIGLPLRSRSLRLAAKDGFKAVTTVAKAVARCNVIIFAFPDHLHGRVFRSDIEPYLKPNSTLIFLHGLSVHFRTVAPPGNCDVLMLAPLAPGAAVREKYLQHQSVGFFYAIHQNFTGKAAKTIAALAAVLRVNRKELVRTTFAEEAVGDIFGEQAVLCGGLSQLIKAGYDTLVDAGLSPEKAYLEVAYQLDLIVDLIKNYGIAGMLDRISVTARYGALLSGPKIIDRQVRTRMRTLLKEIKSGNFAKALDRLDRTDIRRISSMIKKLTAPSFERAARKFSPVRKRRVRKM